MLHPSVISDATKTTDGRNESCTQLEHASLALFGTESGYLRGARRGKPIFL
jgi:hypothetical protein